MFKAAGTRLSPEARMAIEYADIADLEASLRASGVINGGSIRLSG